MKATGYQQIIIAGGDDDVTSAEIFDWVSPLLAGIPGGRWMTCQIELGPENEVLARLRQGESDTIVNLSLDGTAETARDVFSQLPGALSFTMLLLNDFTSQAVTLLDGIARWLNIYELREREIAPVVRLIETIEGMTAAV